MIEFTQGNILESDCEALINTVNLQGVMGKGLALQFRKAFPEMYLAYKQYCYEGKLSIGTMHIWKHGDRYIINFPTKDHWRNSSKMEYITKGLAGLNECIKELGVQSVAIPPLGCGCGKLLWYQVRGEIKKAHDQWWQNFRIVVYEP